ncbi:hypothetical protein [Echinicola vietnamensis]|uniref:hypothetical protein n=1 Tax=Echinicola vietnamensis TaxID=390884 RepID=UPI0005A1FCD1|nr:hypothetical protein [Echinicola vietnamensis]
MKAPAHLPKASFKGCTGKATVIPLPLTGGLSEAGPQHSPSMFKDQPIYNDPGVISPVQGLDHLDKNDQPMHHWPTPGMKAVIP